MSRDALRLMLKRDEGSNVKLGRHIPYTDSVGKTTIGYGRNLSDRGLSMLEADALLEHDIDDAIKDVIARFPWVEWLEPARQGVLVNMSFNLGITRLAGFKRMLSAAQRGDYEAAAVEMLSSHWSEQVGDRALRLAEQMRKNTWI